MCPLPHAPVGEDLEHIIDSGASPHIMGRKSLTHRGDDNRQEYE